MMAEKLFETDIGQLIVELDENHYGEPTINIHVDHKLFGVHELTYTFSDNDHGWELQEETFARIDKQKAYEIVVHSMEKIGL